MKAGVIGWPISHSKSPIIHRYWLETLGLNGSYEMFAIEPAALESFIRTMPMHGLKGVNITIPHKQAAYVLLRGALSVAARQIGAVNTVVYKDGMAMGHNTDADGFLEPLVSMSFTGKSVCVLGAGGAARAVVAALQSRQVGFIAIVSRDRAKATQLLSDMNAKGKAYTWSESATAIEAASLLVNTTSLGMAGQPPLTIHIESLAHETVVYDIVYAPLQTNLLRSATERNLVTIDGLHMLIGQAAIAFELFFEAKPPRDVVHDAALRALLLA